MEHLHSLFLAKPSRPTCLAIGGFDGVHRGHQRVVQQMLAARVPISPALGPETVGAQSNSYSGSLARSLPRSHSVSPSDTDAPTIPRGQHSGRDGAGGAAVSADAGTITGRSCRAAALTFFPLPRQFLSTPRPHYYLTTPEERARLLHGLGVELVITHPFDDRLRNMRAADFVDSLAERLNLGEIWVGPDFALGYQREGDIPFLRAQGETKGFKVRTVDDLVVDGKTVSSSLIRRCLNEGRIRDANRYLGRPFRLPGRVVPGAGRGRQLGFPTANLRVWEDHAYPAAGVYAGRAWVEGSSYPAAINIGFRPTLTAGDQMVIEAHLIGFSGDLHGQEIGLDFLQRIRDEKRFSGPEQLVAQLRRDVDETRRLAAQLGNRWDHQPSCRPRTNLSNASAVHGSAGRKNSR